jgi:hypothetical protein
LRANFLTGTTFAQGDADSNNIVNHQDYFLWRTAFFAGGGSAADIDRSPVPEPTALLSVCFGLTVLVCRRTPRRLR